MFRLTTLGALDLRDGHGRPVKDVLVQPKRVALLVFMALEGRRGPVPRDLLLARFWPESDDARARNALSQSLHHLRQALGPGVIEGLGANSLVFTADKLWCDAAAFADAIERGDPALALDLYRGDFCPALFVSGAPEVEAWLDETRTGLRRQAVTAARALASQLIGSAQTGPASAAVRRALALRPDDEADVRALLEVMDRAGDSTGALTAYQEYARRLATELEAEPEPATRQLAESIRRRREHAGTAQPATAPPAVEPVAVAGTVPLPAPGPAAPRSTTWKKWAAGGALAFAATATLFALTRQPRVSATPSASVAAVFPFTVRGSTAHAYLAEGMVDLLTAKLEGIGGIQATDPRSVIAAAVDQSGGPEALARTARRLGAGYFITGEVIGAAGRLQLNASVHEAAQSRLLASATVAGDSGSLFELVDGLTGQLLVGLAPGRDTALTRLAALSTGSLPALKAFLEGERALRAGQDARATDAFLEAARLDTTFALAQYRLALSSTWSYTRDAEDPTVWAALAARNASRLSPLVRDLLTAYQAYREGRANEAERIYRSLTTARPDNLESWFMLGETYFHWNARRARPFSDAWEPLSRVLQLDSSNVHAALHLAHLAAATGRRATLDTLVRTFSAQHGGADRVAEMRALPVLLDDDVAARRALVRDSRNLDQYQIIALVTAAISYAENLAAALDLATVVDELVRVPRVRILASWILAGLVTTGGDWDAALEALPPDLHNDDWLLETEVWLASEPQGPVPIERVAALYATVMARSQWPVHNNWTRDQNHPLGPALRSYSLGLLAARLGDTVAVANRVAELESAPVHEYRARLAAALRAARARARGDLQLAYTELHRFIDSPDTGVLNLPVMWGVAERFALGEVLLGLGREDEALTVFESFRMLWDAPFFAPAHLRAAELHARSGNPEQARFHHDRAARLWRSGTATRQQLLARSAERLQRMQPRRRNS